jgi:hypothetical protein
MYNVHCTMYIVHTVHICESQSISRQIGLKNAGTIQYNLGLEEDLGSFKRVRETLAHCTALWWLFFIKYIEVIQSKGRQISKQTSEHLVYYRDFFIMRLRTWNSF